jgi:hypothetical protein
MQLKHLEVCVRVPLSTDLLQAQMDTVQEQCLSFAL